jgi:hypothetical protein
MVFVSTISFILLNNQMPNNAISIFLISIGVCYYGLQFLFNYRLGILALIDRVKKDYESKVISIESVKIESSWSGWLWHSIITSFYPKELEVNRYKIICSDESGNKDTLRLVMSREQSISLYDLFIMEYKISEIQTTYCKRTKILIKLDMINDVKKNYTKRENSEIIYAISRINRKI